MKAIVIHIIKLLSLGNVCDLNLLALIISNEILDLDSIKYHY